LGSPRGGPPRDYSYTIHQAAGWNTVRIAVDFEEFQAFAEAAKLPLTYGLLHAYAYQKWLHQARPSRGPLP